MMATVPHVTSGLGLRKFQTDGFLLTLVYHAHEPIRSSGAIQGGDSLRRRTITTSTNAPLKYEAVQRNREQLKMGIVRIHLPNIPSHFSKKSHATGSIRDSDGKGFQSKLVHFQQTWEDIPYCQIALFYVM